jgi:hypothetical protein
MADETPAKSPEQLLAEAQEAQRQADTARAAHLAPLRAIVDRPAFKEIYEGLNALAPTYALELGFAHIHGVASIMPRLKDWLDGQPKAE